jgi:hypothetical protein
MDGYTYNKFLANEKNFGDDGDLYLIELSTSSTNEVCVCAMLEIARTPLTDAHSLLVGGKSQNACFKIL